MVRVLTSTISTIAKTTDLNSARSKLNRRFLNKTDYYFPEKEFASIIGRLMLQQLLSEANMDDRIVQTMHHGPYGKMQVDGPVDFNISHSADTVVAVFSDQPVIGVDIEKIRSFEWHECSDLFTAADWEIICASSDSEKAFFEFWTKKESLLKAYGLGLQIPLNQVTIYNNAGRIGNTPMTGYFTEVKIPEYICHVCTHTQISDLRIERFNM